MIRYRDGWFIGDLVFGPGVAIPVPNPRLTIFEFVLNIMGRDFDAVEFDWPARGTS